MLNPSTQNAHNVLVNNFCFPQRDRGPRGEAVPGWSSGAARRTTTATAELLSVPERWRLETGDGEPQSDPRSHPLKTAPRKQSSQ